MLGVISLLIFSTGCQDSQTPTTSASQSQTTTSPANTSANTQASGTTTPTNSIASNTPSTPSMSTASGTATSPAQSTTSPSTPSNINSNIIVNHSNWDWYVSQPQQVVDAVASMRYFFSHASVGTNIVDGLKALNSSDAARYPLKIKTVGASALDSTVKGTFYEYPRGNSGGWSAKVQDFQTVVQNGWRDPAVEVAMYKFCFIDYAADWTAYRDSIINMERLYPNTHFIYWTMPITTGDTEEKLSLRAKFNQNLRDWIATQENKILFDLADIEAWGPSGEHKTQKANGITCDLLYGGYTVRSDGGHLFGEGMTRVATALYSLFGLLATP